MGLMELLGCFDACGKLGLEKSKKRLEKVIDGVTKQLLNSQKQSKTKAEPNAETEAKQETAA
jgi:hypothetical protein